MSSRPAVDCCFSPLASSLACLEELLPNLTFPSLIGWQVFQCHSLAPCLNENQM